MASNTFIVVVLVVAAAAAGVVVIAVVIITYTDVVVIYPVSCLPRQQQTKCFDLTCCRAEIEVDQM